MRARILVSGTVQGVGFRPFVYRAAVEHSLVGFVKNRGDAGVLIVVQGSTEEIDNFVQDLKTRKPPLANYDSFEIKKEENGFDLTKFSIVQSSQERVLSGSVIPPDIAICKKCIEELKSPTNRRHDYFFITCTDCGPRFSIIKKLPYDRPNTTMKFFDLCEDCALEYGNPEERRFHAQTIACKRCGPEVFLVDRNGKRVDYCDPIRAAGRLLEEGQVVAIKGVGGFHMATSALKAGGLEHLRRTKHRKQKPFAVMARDPEVAKTFAIVDDDEMRLLTSPERPIVLLQKNKTYYLSELVSPGLHNVGVMLPYTALHLMLFDEVREPVFVMTSANPPGEPLAKENTEAIRTLGDVADFFLFHNREIAHRNDDSVVRINNRVTSFVRRSRGFAPSPVRLRRPMPSSVLAVGAEFTVAACILIGEKAFLTQHIGDIETLQNYLFLNEAIDHLLELTNTKPEVIASDLHPTMQTTRLAKRMGESLNLEVIQVQHHHSHAASIMAEEGLNELIAVTCDGVGYGSDGSLWGGEVLVVEGASFTRAAHLEPQPMLGGDLAAYFPVRMIAGMLEKFSAAEHYLYDHAHLLPGGKKEAEIVLTQLRARRSPFTTSTGRVLDAASVLLGLCNERTYEGEPAMKLETASIGGEDVLRLEPEIKNGVLGTTNVIRALLESLGRFKVADLAYSVQDYLAKGFATMALNVAQTHGIRRIGFGGGVAYNAHFMRRIRGLVEEQGMTFHTNRQVPAGDGGLSLGQAYVASLKAEQDRA